MTFEQATLFTILFFVFVLLIWGRWRYDLVAFTALVVALIAGVVPVDQAFDGFGHPATVIVALVLVASRGLSNSGVVELIASYLINSTRQLSTHIGIMAGLSATLSTVMNNVAALALLMPVDMEAAKKAKRSPALTLMPLSFASILGGMVTLIGTPPNIIIATFRDKAVGEPFTMFDFTPVGATAAIVGIIFVALIGWRLIPAARSEMNAPESLFEISDYLAELKVDESSKSIGQKISELEEASESSEIQIVGLVRNNQRLPGSARYVRVMANDILLIQGGPEGIEKFAGKLGLKYMGSDQAPEISSKSDLTLSEAVVPEHALIAGQSARSLRLGRRYGIYLVGVSRRGQPIHKRLRHLTIMPGDILLFLGADDAVSEATRGLGCLPLAKRGLQLIRREKAGLAVAIFSGAILLASLGILALPIALSAVVALYAFTGIVPLRELYDHIEWPVIILLAALIPLGIAFETTGGAALISQQLVAMSHGYSAVFVLVVLMLVTMSLADVMNNTATTVIAAPLAVQIAHQLKVSPDPFLMGVAVAASCAFLTPIGHKNNTLILGPGGYSFGDYWRMGLPLELLVLAVSLPMILLVWPL